MTNLPSSLYTSEQVRELDQTAIEKFSIRGYTLMQRAGEFAFKILRERWPEAEKVLILAGTGNNGGDGYVVARLAFEAGLEVDVFQVGLATKITGDAKAALEDYLYVGGHLELYEGEPLPAMEVIVDALFGTGLSNDVEELWAMAIQAINKHPANVLSLDIPSGLNANTGQALGIAVQADCTVSFVGLKQGLLTGQARDYCGELEFDGLRLPIDVYAAQKPAAHHITLAHYRALLKPRPRSGHKGKFGHVLVIGGQPGMAGAARMAGEAAARVGAGLVSVATHPEHASVIAASCPILMARGVNTAAELEPLLKRATVIIVGPGLGQSNWAKDLLSAAVKSELPLIVDADALNLLAGSNARRDNWILTPHPGEAARLLGKNSSSNIEINRYGAATELQSCYGGICILKGAGTLICSEDRTAVCSQGNPGMATGGMGDVLSGVIAGLAAQQIPLRSAAELGVCVHAVAGDKAAASGERGMLAIDLLEHLRTVVNPGNT